MICDRPVSPVSRPDLEHVLEGTAGLWSEARGESFFITGGTGFFGMWLLETFAAANETHGLGARAVVLSRNPEAFAARAPHLLGRGDLQFVRGSMCDFAIPAGRFKYVVHAATETGAGAEAAARILDASIDGTRRVLDLARRAGTEKLLLTSSGAVYGPQPAEITHVSERYLGAPDPLAIGSAYGEGKRLAEHLCVAAAKRHGFEAKIARCFAFVGPHLPLNGGYAIGNFMQDALAGREIEVKSDGTPRRSYLYAADLAVWLWTLLFKGAAGEAYNVGSEEDLSLKEIAETVCRIIPTARRVRVALQSQLGAPAPRYVPSTRKAQDGLGLRARIPLVEAIRRTAEWHRGEGKPLSISK